MRQTKAETERTKTALLDAAEILFWEQGAARTAVLDIARKAGLTRGAFYHHFKDKAAVFAALIERGRVPQEEDVQRIAERGDVDALAMLRASCRGAFELFAEDKVRQRMFGIVMHRRESLGDLEKLAEARRREMFRSSEAFERLLKKARKAGQLSEKWTPSVAAMTLYSAIMGLLDQWIRNPDSFDIRKLGIDCIDQLLTSFTKEPTHNRRRT